MLNRNEHEPFGPLLEIEEIAGITFKTIFEGAGQRNPMLTAYILAKEYWISWYETDAKRAMWYGMEYDRLIRDLKRVMMNPEASKREKRLAIVKKMGDVTKLGELF